MGGGTGRQARPTDWIYYKLYLGNAVDRCDGLIVECVPNFLELPGIERWFFLRYLDERGFHLRLRYLVERDRAVEFREQARGVAERALRQLPLLPPSDYFPMVPPPGGETDSAPNTPVGVEEEPYEPELDKFGGDGGMPIAEQLFEESSRVALALLDAEARGVLSRKTVAPCLMQAATDAFRLKQSEADFWRDYSFYWLGSRSPAANDFRDRFFAKGESLREDGIPVVAPLESLSEAARSQLELWTDALRRAAGAYRHLGSLGHVTPDVLAFNFTHLMNNRLGLYALEEAYLAALLEQRAESYSAA